MSDYPYDPDLPYVVEPALHATVRARFNLRSDAEAFAEGKIVRVIDTAPKPRVPNDARFITWISEGYRCYAEGINNTLWMDNDGRELRIEDLPGVTPDTVFTVLDERKS